MDQECCSQLVQWGGACTTLMCPSVRCSAGQGAEKQIEGSCGVLDLPSSLWAPRGQP